MVLLGLIAVESLESGVPTRQLFMIPYQIPTKYYPLALYGLFSLLGGPDLGMGFGLALGYAYAYGHVRKQSKHPAAMRENELYKLPQQLARLFFGLLLLESSVGLRHAVRRAGREHGTRRLPRQARATAGLHCPGERNSRDTSPR